MLQDTDFICYLNDNLFKEQAFEKFKNYHLYNPNEKYILVYDSDTFRWKVYKLILD